MAMKMFDTKDVSTAVSLVGFDPDADECIIVYKGKMMAYQYYSVAGIIDALYGEASIGQRATRLKINNNNFHLFPAELQTHDGHEFFYLNKKLIGLVTPIQELRDEVSNGLSHADAWAKVTGQTFNDGRLPSVVPIKSNDFSRSYAW